MIPETELRGLAHRWNIDLMLLDPDYSLGCFLAGLGEQNLAGRLRFEGRTCLRKCYFLDYRFSEDLDFTAETHLSATSLQTLVEKAVRWVEREIGLDFTAPKSARPRSLSTLWMRFSRKKLERWPGNADTRSPATCMTFINYSTAERRSPMRCPVSPPNSRQRACGSKIGARPTCEQGGLNSRRIGAVASLISYLVRSLYPFKRHGKQFCKSCRIFKVPSSNNIFAVANSSTPAQSSSVSKSSACVSGMPRLARNRATSVRAALDFCFCGGNTCWKFAARCARQMNWW